MRNLKILVLFSAFLFLIIGTVSNAASVETVKQKIISKCNEMGVEPAIMLSIAKTESGFRQEARGASGTVGVFQLMPSTGRALGVNPYDLDGNITGGVKYYKNLYNMFGSRELAVAAYNLGPVPVKNCRCVPNSAKRFVTRILADYNYYKTN